MIGGGWQQGNLWRKHEFSYKMGSQAMLARTNPSPDIVLCGQSLPASPDWPFKINSLQNNTEFKLNSQ